MLEICKTKDYSIFKRMSGNRPIDRFHLKRLKNSIQSDNQLFLHPIIVNKDFYLIDGQHRLEVARQLDLEVYYIQSSHISDMHLIQCNVNQKSWEIENYIDYFSKKENSPDYLKLKEVLIATGLRPKAMLTLVLGSVNVKILNFLKTGKFKFPKSDNLDDIMAFYFHFSNYVKDKRLKPYSMFTNHSFTRALRWLFNTTGFDEETFFKKLDMRWFDLKPQSGAEEWYSLLISIYNFKSQVKLEEEYGKEVEKKKNE